ncbi:MAG: NAD(P)-dependent oxidoreductase [Chloroflexi bacterium]|nr:NAD(P)-dependent oxidoreductase [Chloroflexota bacterium]
MKILVTGITGRVGANIASRFIENGHDVRGFVWPGDRMAENMNRVGAEIVEGDLRSRDDVMSAAAGRDTIFHLGAAFQAGGPFTPEQYFDINVKGLFNILEAGLALGDDLRHLIFTSTDATMFKYPPEGIEEPIREDSLPLSTTDWYGYSKVLGENLVDRYVRQHDLPATVIRFANVWGAGEVLTWPQFYLKTFLRNFEGRTDDIGRATYEALKAEDDAGDKLIIACDANGRPWKKHSVEVRDLVHGFEAAAGILKTFGKTYQLAAPTPFTWDEAVPHLANVLDLPYCRVNIAGAAPTYYEYDLSAARSDFGYDPQVGFEQAVEEAIAFKSGKSDAVISR